MRSRRPTSEQQETVSRRLALLSEQLAAARDATPVVEPALRVEEAPVAPAAGGEWWVDHTRVAPARAPLRMVPQPQPQPQLQPAQEQEQEQEPVTGPVTGPIAGPASSPETRRVPEPGRHAARRAPAWTDLVPETLRGRAGLGPGPVAVVALLVAVALGLTCWQVLRDDPAPPVPAVAPADDLVAVTGVPEAAAPSPAPGTGAPTGSVTVDVAGRVRRPGIVVLDTGARVVDALDEAGGARPAVDLSSLNLARLLVDGEQILVGVPGSPAAPPVEGAAPSGAAPAALVDLNLADQALLETLPDVGPVTAAAIITWREEHGAFTAVTELLEVSGIGDATLATLTPLVTV